MPLPDPASSNKNAFSVLMSRKSGEFSPRSRRCGTEFVVCPAGCGKRMLERDVNQHLDQCIGSQHEATETVAIETPASQGGSRRNISGKRKRVTCPACEKAFPSSLINLHLDQCVTRSVNSRSSRATLDKKADAESDLLSQLPTCELEEETTLRAVSTAASPTDDKSIKLIVSNGIRNEIDTKNVASLLLHLDTDTSDGVINMGSKGASHETMSKIVSQSPEPNSVFATMMKQSKTVFANREKAMVSIHLRFHLDESCRVTLSYPMNVETEWTPPNWSVAINLKDRHPNSKLGIKPPQNIELTLSSSIPIYQDPIRWVRRHSRLSVPVLKSILQKSIRRRKPLPAVRVAMELADKSLGDLLRRLPIIILEDSTLHPDMKFIVWMMMAYSKDYQPSPQSMMRLFHIIYEIAACQWFDDIPATISTRQSEDVPSNSDLTIVTLTSLFSTAESISDGASFNDATTMLWSMLARAEYGGMQCDVDMLYSFAGIWSARMTSQIFVPDEIARRVLVKPNESTIRWSEMPFSIHRKVHEQGQNRVASLCTAGVDRLVMEDICVEGVDFHCSSIIDELLADDELCGLCYDLVILAKPSESDGTQVLPTRRACLENIFKSAIWNFCSKVNHRRPLLPTTKNDSTSLKASDSNAELWNEWIAPRVVRFQKSYVEERLAK